MKNLRYIKAETPQNRNPQSTAGRIPAFGREIILMLYVGVMAILGLQRHYRPEQHVGIWRARHPAARSHRSYLAIKPRRFGIDAWACDPRPHWQLRLRARWLSSRDINNSPDPRVRRIGYDEWYTRRPYSRVPGIGFSRLKSRKNNPHPDRAARSPGTRRTEIMGVDPSRRRLSAAPQGEVILVPP